MTSPGTIDRARRAALDSSPFAVVGSDAMGRVIVWNAAAERLLGWSASEVLGRELLEFGVVPPGQETDRFESHRRSTLAGDPAAGSIEAVRVRRDGTSFPARIWPAPLHDDDGELVGFLGFLLDITDEQRRERARRRRGALPLDLHAVARRRHRHRPRS